MPYNVGMKQYITVAELAKLLGVHQETVYRWLREGKIKHIRIGRFYHIDRDAVLGQTTKG